MAKYSTGGIGGEPGESCELCGEETADLRTARVAGAQLEVCADCAQHDETTGGRGDTSDRPDPDRRRRAAQHAARVDDARKGDPTYWEHGGVDYEDDPLPYLVRGYGDRVEQARQAAGLQTDELASELGADEADIVAIEQGRAARAGIGGSLVEALEDRLDVQLVDASE